LVRNSPSKKVTKSMNFVKHNFCVWRFSRFFSAHYNAASRIRVLSSSVPSSRFLIACLPSASSLLTASLLRVRPPPPSVLCQVSPRYLFSLSLRSAFLFFPRCLSQLFFLSLPHLSFGPVPVCATKIFTHPPSHFCTLHICSLSLRFFLRAVRARVSSGAALSPSFFSLYVTASLAALHSLLLSSRCT
jgi:hypothetical protein